MDSINLFNVQERVENVLNDNFFSPKTAEKVAEAVSEDVLNELGEYDCENTALDEIDDSQFRDAMLMPVQHYLDEHLA